MPYLLMHQFDPDFDHTRLTPRLAGSGMVDHYNMGYVQNVMAGQRLAEFTEISQEQAAGQTRFVYDAPVFPQGEGTQVAPDNPLALVATRNGYVLYLEGRITVREQLNVRRDVDFHTGNVIFVGILHVHGEVKSGFAIKAKQVEVDDVIGGATVEAKETILCHSGIKGEKSALLRAGFSLTGSFAENAELVAGKAMEFKGSVLHCRSYCGGDVTVGGRLQGGATYCMGRLHVGEQLGGGSGTVTQVILGRNPFMLLKEDSLLKAIEEADEVLEEVAERKAMGPASAKEFLRREEETLARKATLQQQLSVVQDRLHSQPMPEQCELVVEGRVLPTVEVTIGQAQFLVESPLERVRFRVVNGAVAVTPL